MSWIGGQEDPGYAKFSSAEHAPDSELAGNVIAGLSSDVQQWVADTESSYVIVHGDWGFLNFTSDLNPITAWYKANKYA